MTYIAKTSIMIAASPEKVWAALTDPVMIKQYLFGTTVSSDWKEGSPITYKGEWQGIPYEDKGLILRVEPEKLLESTYWSSMSGLADVPENYKKVTYMIDQGEGGLMLSITQDNNPTEEAQQHSEQNWNVVLIAIKKLLEI